MIAFKLWKIGHQHLHSLQNPATANHSHSLGRLLDVFKKTPYTMSMSIQRALFSLFSSWFLLWPKSTSAVFPSGNHQCHTKSAPLYCKLKQSFLDEYQMKDSKSLATLFSSTHALSPLGAIHEATLEAYSINVLAQGNFVSC